jgi:hypothetical protein
MGLFYGAVARYQAGTKFGFHRGTSRFQVEVFKIDDFRFES